MRIRKFLSCLFVFVLSFTLFACTTEKEVVSIEMEDSVVQAAVADGKVELGELKLLVTFDDESKKTIDVTNDMITSGKLALMNKSGEYSLVITYKGKEVKVDFEIPYKELTYQDNTTLNMGVVHNSTKTSISFKDASITGEGLELADGNTYHTGDLKPVWAQLEKELKVKFNDVYTGASSADNEFKAWKNQNYEGVDVLVGNASSITEAGKMQKIVNLGDYLSYMPNLSKFLNDNPIVYLSVLSDVDNGSMYYAPYFDGFDDIEKYFLMRTDWVKKLLDGEGEFTETSSDTFGTVCKEAKYQPYMPTTGKLPLLSLNKAGTGTETITKDYTKQYGNIIKYMNENVTSSTTGVELVNMLRNYIDSAYNNYYGTTRSDLFIGYNACWDADELVALLRCIVCNTFALTGQSEVKVTGLFPRESTLNRTSDLLSLVSLFGVRGNESRCDYLYFNSEGKLIDARCEEDFNGAIDKLSSLYKEGLIYQGFDTTTATIYKDMYQKNQGFMLYDYCQTQCLYNEDKTTKQKCPEFNLSPVLNPVAKWYDGTNVKNDKDEGTYMRFTESWRSVKTSGWCIPKTCTGDKLYAALKLFDYMYSEEGAILMSYGPTAWRSGSTIDYKGNQVPEMSEAAKAELWDLGKGNYTNYARMYLGSTLPIGFVKDQGMEYQCTTEGGKAGALKVSQAIAKGVIKHVTPYISENMFYTMSPTTLPTTAEDETTLAEYPALFSKTGIYSKERGCYNILIDVLKTGFGSDVDLTSTLVTKMPETSTELITKFKEDLGGKQYYLFNNRAWEKIKKFYNDNLVH